MATAKAQGQGQGPAFPSSGKDQVTLLSKSQGCDKETSSLLRHIFQSSTEAKGDGKSLEFTNLSHHLDEELKGIVEKNREEIEILTKKDDVGRLGPENTVFDYKGTLGTFVIEADRLGLSSHSNFSSIRANTCVFKGRWVYELMLGSRGVMQLGWCTASCTFTQEEGVGDTDDSYAYDGNRQRKWNMKSPTKYGEVWLTGDVISSAIDCDTGRISFYRNGRCMGEAFSNIRLGPGMAYFPAVSLSMSENLKANFGATPLRYPIEGYRPIQDPPMVDLVKAQYLFEHLERTVPLIVEASTASAKPPAEEHQPRSSQASSRSKRTTLMLATAHIFDKLAPLLKSPYIVEAGLLKFLLQFCDVREVCGQHVLIQQSLAIIWMFMQEVERKHCLENLMSSLMSAYRFSPAMPDFAYQLTFLVLAYAILKHEPTRKFLIKNVLFDKIKFPAFMHVKLPDDEGLIELIPHTCLDLGDRISVSENDDSPEETPSEEVLQLRAKYFESCAELQKRVAELEYMQTEILKLLLVNSDNSKGGASTRFVFLHKFREFLKDNSQLRSRSSALWINQCPPSVSLCFFHRLIRALRFYWDEFHEINPMSSCPSSEAFIPCSNFYDDSVNFFDLQRLGGLQSHLKKTYHEEIQKAISGEPAAGMSAYLDKIVNFSSHLEQQKQRYEDRPLGSGLASCHSLVEILDGVVLLYNIAAHKQLEKMCSLRDNVHEYVDALKDADKKIAACPSHMTEILAELERSKQVFQEKGTEQVRQMAWVVAVIYAQEKQADVYWLLQVILRTINEASKHGNLFSFLPDYYVESCIHGYQALRSYFHPTRPYSNLPGFMAVLNEFATFLSNHFADDRIVNADSKDSLVQALACFVCYPHSLNALETISEESRLRLTRALLAPCENRSWAQTNWILVRLWKGCGFGFRYTHLPHMGPNKTQQPDHIGKKPCPSMIFQEHIKLVLSSEESTATKFIDTVLSQLNWTFSEFIGMLQELQSIASRPSAALIDGRHLKICATCFEISVSLMRLLEMILALAPEIFTDWSKPLAEQLLCRLCQLLSQVLNRITSKSNTFDMVVAANIPGLETVDHFPILAAVTGILVQLLLNTQGNGQERAVQALLAEPGFQVSCLEFLTGGTIEDTATLSVIPSGTKKQFTLANYKEQITEEELQKTENLIAFMKLQQAKEQKQTTEVDEDKLCEICYARPKSVRFLPCDHQSCKSCITHQMMNKKECFFCKAKVTDIVDTEVDKPT